MNKVLLILSIFILIACKSNSNNDLPKAEQKACVVDSDCACGTNITTGECFFGNKKFVETKKQCPDFCTGIAGNFKISCQNNQCTQAKNTSSIVTPVETDATMCTFDYKPVCGIDKVTYPNECVATKQKKIKIAYKGECKN